MVIFAFQSRIGSVFFTFVIGVCSKALYFPLQNYYNFYEIRNTNPCFLAFFRSIFVSG